MTVTNNYTTPPDWSTSYVVLADDLDTYLSSNFNFLYRTKGARVNNSANISCANGATTMLTFNSERYDTDAIHSTSSNTSRFTFPIAGRWLITAHVSMALNGTGQRAIQLFLNTSTVIASQVVPANANINTDLSIAVIYNFALSDYVEMGIFQNSGGALNATAASNYSPEFACQWLGA